MSWRAQGGIKRYTADKWVSLCVRHAADHICEYCGVREATDCCHINGRSDFTTRWCKDNLFAGCRHCHDYLGQHPLDMTEWLDAKWPDRRTMLQVKRRGKLKNNADTRKLVADHYRKEYRRMQEDGTKEFESWN